MIQVGSIVKVTDKTGVMFAQCIKVLNNSKIRIAYLGDMVIVSVVRINPRKFVNVKERWRLKFLRGTVHRGLLVRTKVNIRRASTIYLKFNENTIIIVTSQGVPVSNKVFGPILLELCMKWPSIGCVTGYFL
jgi:large subunit ribosomal protein L14